MMKQLSDPYIRQAMQFDDGHFVVLYQFSEQSDAFFSISEIQADKMFRQTHCREFELNTFNNFTRCTLTLFSIWTDYENEEG